MNIDNLKLQTKMLIPLMAISVVVVGMLGFSAIELNTVSRKASAIIRERDGGVMLLTRANRRMLDTINAVYSTFVYDKHSSEKVRLLRILKFPCSAV